MLLTSSPTPTERAARTAGGAGIAAGIRTTMERAVTAVRLVSAAYCLIVFAGTSSAVAHPGLGWAVMGGILTWTAIAVGMQASGSVSGRAARGGWWFVGLDVAVVAALTLATIAVQTDAQRLGTSATLTTVWAVCPALTAGARSGLTAGLAAAALQSLVSIVVAEGADSATLANVLLLLLAGTATGYLARLASRAEAQAVASAAVAASAAERERLARDIHDGVLQVLSLVHRRGAEIGGAAAELGRLAGEQERVLRGLVARAAPDPGSGAVDLAAACGHLRADRVTVSAPGHPVLLDAHAAGELLAAARAALDNVQRHAGPSARAWVLLEEDAQMVVLSVRDDGIGIAPGRLDDSAADHRMGVAQSIVARVGALGGSASIGPGPGGGTEVELRVPRAVMP